MRQATFETNIKTFWKGLLPVLFIVALLLAFSDTTHPSQVHAAAAFVQDTSAGVASGTTLTTSSVTVTGGNLLVLGILHNSGITPTISDSRGNTYQLDRQGATFDGTRTVAVYSAIANSSGSLTATVSVTTAQRLGLILTEFSGMDTSASRVDQSNTAAGAGLTASSGNITTTVSNVLLYGLAGHQSNTAATLGVGYSNLEAPGGEGRSSSESKVVSGTVTDDADFGLGTSRNFSAIVVAYKPSGGGGTPPPPPPPATTFFTEGFENTSFSSRGWYDATNHPITTSQPHSGTAAAQYHWAVGDTQPSGLAGMRHLFTASDSTYVSYWVKYSSNFIGSNQTYHPHEFLLLTSANTAYAGPAYTRLTGYIEQNYRTTGGLTGGVPLVGLQDGQNIDLAQLNQNLIGVTENRAVTGCNGNPTNDGHTTVDCYPVGGGTYWNGTQWLAPGVYFDNNASSQNYKGNWHHVEAYFQMNTITNGVANQNGVLQYWYDGQQLINRNNVYMRTNQNATMQWNQFIIAPYIGSGSPVDQYMWVDDLTIGSAAPGGTSPPPPTISSFTASPTTITSGSSSTLSWTTSNATSLSINQGIGTVTGTSRSVSPTATTTYTLTATNSAGSVTANTTVTVNPVTPPPPPTGVLFQTTFPDSTCPAWNQSMGLSDAQVCATGDGIAGWGGWTANGQGSEIISLANNPSGGGGKGHRSWVCDGHTCNSGNIMITFSQTKVPEFWIRWYARWEQGFAWNPLFFHKLLYIDVGTSHFAIPGFTSNNSAYLATWPSGDNDTPGSFGWDTVMANGGTANGMKTSDGQWHCFETHINIGNGSTNGVGEFWIDNALTGQSATLNYNTTTGYSFFEIPSNADNPANGQNAYEDQDDIVVSNSARIGCLGSTTPPPPAPTISSFTTSPSTITSGSSSTLTWTTSNATSLSINQGIGTVTGTSRSVSPTSTTTYTLTATNAAGSVTANTTVTVNPVTPPPPPVGLIFNTTFPSNNCPEWNQTIGLSDSQVCVSGDGITGNGGWTTSAGSVDQITSPANNQTGGGGRGFRHWVGDGYNNGGGGIVVSWPGSPEIWLRYYIRFESGFTWGGPTNMKTIYCNRGQPGTFYFGLLDSSGGKIAGHVEVDPTNSGNKISNLTWQQWQSGSSVGDGLFHSLEVHAKMNTTGTLNDGVWEFWLDGTQIYSNSSIHFANTTGATFSNCAVGENHNNPQNGADAYVDFDDLAISTTGYIGPTYGIPSGTPPPPPPPAPSTYSRTINIVSLQGRSSGAVSGTLEVLSSPGKTLLATYPLTTNTSGSATITFNVPLQTVYLKTNATPFLDRVIQVDLNNTGTYAFPQLYIGDINQDNFINSVDYSTLNTNWFTANASADLNQDSLVNSIDFSYMNTHWLMGGEQ